MALRCHFIVGGPLFDKIKRKSRLGASVSNDVACDCDFTRKLFFLLPLRCECAMCNAFDSPEQSMGASTKLISESISTPRLVVPSQTSSLAKSDWGRSCSLSFPPIYFSAEKLMFTQTKNSTLVARRCAKKKTIPVPIDVTSCCQTTIHTPP